MIQQPNVRDAMVWAVGRLGQRVPVYGPLNTVVPLEKAAAWLERLLRLGSSQPIDFLAAMQLARRTDDRYRDLPPETRADAAGWLESAEAPPHLAALIRDVGQLDEEEQVQVFGESLPKGLRIG